MSTHDTAQESQSVSGLIKKMQEKLYKGFSLQGDNGKPHTTAADDATDACSAAATPDTTASASTTPLPLMRIAPNVLGTMAQASFTGNLPMTGANGNWLMTPITTPAPGATYLGNPYGAFVGGMTYTLPTHLTYQTHTVTGTFTSPEFWGAPPTEEPVSTRDYYAEEMAELRERVDHLEQEKSVLCDMLHKSVSRVCPPVKSRKPRLRPHTRQKSASGKYARSRLAS